MKKDVKLYNIIFPIWLLLIFPLAWIVVLPANFIIDWTVTYQSMRYLKIQDANKLVKSVILKVWLCGFVADLVGVAIMFSVNVIELGVFSTQAGKWWNENIMIPVNYNPFGSIYAFIWVMVCVVISGVVIYFLNAKFCFRKLEIDELLKKKLALSLAVFTAPYVFLIPTSLFY